MTVRKTDSRGRALAQLTTADCDDERAAAAKPSTAKPRRPPKGVEDQCSGWCGCGGGGSGKGGKRARDQKIKDVADAPKRLLLYAATKQQMGWLKFMKATSGRVDERELEFDSKATPLHSCALCATTFCVATSVTAAAWFFFHFSLALFACTLCAALLLVLVLLRSQSISHKADHDYWNFSCSVALDKPRAPTVGRVRQGND